LRAIAGILRSLLVLYDAHSHVRSHVVQPGH